MTTSAIQDAPAFSPQQVELATQIGHVLEKAIEQGLGIDLAVGVMCALSANLVSMDPSRDRQRDAMTAFGAGLVSETDRLSSLRVKSDVRYRDAVAAEAANLPQPDR